MPSPLPSHHSQCLCGYLESLGEPALIISEKQQIVALNAPASSLLPERHGAPAGIAQLVASGWLILELGRQGAERWWLALRERPANRKERASSLGALWRLTAREQQILELVAAGDSNKDIAVTLECSERTVEVHVSRVLYTSGAPSRGRLAAQFWGGFELRATG